MIVTKTHEEILGQFVQDVQDLLNSIEKKHEYLKEVKDDSERTKAHWTQKLIKEWFFRHGY